MKMPSHDRQTRMVPLRGSLAGACARQGAVSRTMIHQDEFPSALELAAAGHVKTTPLVTHRFPLAEIAATFAAHRDPASIKVAVLVS